MGASQSAASMQVVQQQPSAVPRRVILGLVSTLLVVGTMAVFFYSADAKEGTVSHAAHTELAAFIQSPPTGYGDAAPTPPPTSYFIHTAPTGYGDAAPTPPPTAPPTYLVPVKKWDFATGGQVWSSPTLSPDGSVVYAGSFDQSLYAVDTADGTKKWAFHTGSGVYSS